MKTYKVTFQMESPVCFIDRPHFDGILLYCLMKEKYGNIPVEFNESELSELPLKIHEDGYPLASVMFFDNSVEYTGSWKKRWDNKNDDLADFKKRLRKFPLGEGVFKSYDMPLNLWSIPEVRFYFCSDNVQRVQHLLITQLAGIGKKVSQGYGFYNKFEISEVLDISFDTQILRPLKTGLDSTSRVLKNIYQLKKGFTLHKRYCAWKPPYTMPDNFAHCFYPGVKE